MGVLMRPLVILCILVMGCTTVPKTPQELKISRASIAAGDNETKVETAGLPGKGTGALVGAAGGAGSGVGTAALLSIGCGPMYGPCLVGLSILLGPAGATVGSMVGAATTEDADAVETKRRMLTEALIALDASRNLGPLVYKKSLESSAITQSPTNKTSTSVDPEWALRITLDEFATVGSGPDTPYSL